MRRKSRSQVTAASAGNAPNRRHNPNFPRSLRYAAVARHDIGGSRFMCFRSRAFWGAIFFAVSLPAVAAETVVEHPKKEPAAGFSQELEPFPASKSIRQ